ncbi:hypothetical protein [Nocardia sp. CA-120079]|uniref:hypothetical protein n=1 Tax=Nocardia sp. CA-120079 TaxID=3239974 RepID=UPI003D97D759
MLPEYQKSGVGAAAIRAGLAAAEQLGGAFVIVLGHPTYYPRLGFGTASEYSIEVPDEALMALTLDPAPRGTVRYAAPFGID